MSFGSIANQLVGQCKPILAQKQVLLLSSQQGASRRSTQFVSHILRNQINCTVQPATVGEPSLQASKDGLAMLQRTRCSAVVAVGGATVLDAAKFIAQLRDDPIDLVLLPTVPAGGKETSKDAELFDWEKEERIVLQGKAPMTIIDPELALEDKISARKDADVFLASAALLLNQSVSSLRNQGSLIEALRDGFRISSSTSAAKYSPQERHALFLPSLQAPVDRVVAEEHSIDAVVGNVILSHLALPRSLLRSALFVSFAEERAKQSDDFAKILQEITSAPSLDESLNRTRVLGSQTSSKGNVRSLLLKYMDAKSAELLRESMQTWFEVASDEPQYSEFDLSSKTLERLFV